MISFGMSNTIVNFKDKFFEYDWDVDNEERGLTIWGYESAWLADLAAAFILEKIKNNSKKLYIMEYTATMDLPVLKEYYQQTILKHGYQIFKKK